MEPSKVTKLSADELRLAKMFKALGNPVRLEILRQLSDCQYCICNDIVAVLPLAQSTVSQHLKVLKEAGLIRGEIEGPATCYCIDLDNLEWFKSRVSGSF
jgi:ArsR family transcriptional regulator